MNSSNIFTLKQFTKRMNDAFPLAVDILLGKEHLTNQRNSDILS